jgi:hypothetical protein
MSDTKPAYLATIPIIRVKPGGPIPVGYVFEIPEGKEIPEGWIRADGSRFDAKQYPELAVVLDNTYGRRRLPDFRRRLPDFTIRVVPRWKLWLRWRVKRKLSPKRWEGGNP